MWGKLKRLSVFSPNWKWIYTWPRRFWCLSDQSQLPWNLCRWARVHDQTCPCKHWFTWRILQHLLSVVTWYIVRSQAILIVNRYCTVLCHLWVKYCVVDTFNYEYNLPVIPKKNTHFRTYFYMIFLCFDINNLHLKFSPTFYTHPVGTDPLGH